ncbi:site-specific integrase [Polyangium sp. 6x1]|uniref:tyrosine-type recombinase/integrase n=1 Tax=Polyangium sp. 6x1 TaxID=3042689 RepID=UPI0024831980|nr:site-specific integrase [Polyangium sp. 6x1]MDI1445958.1 site-specific integrase [Polyangium sp. 6x1]
MNIAKYGSPYEPGSDGNSSEGPPPSTEAVKTFANVVDEFRQTFMITDLKVTSRKGYESVLGSTLLPKFGELPITQVDGNAAAGLDLELSKRKLKPGTRNNVQIVLRSVMKFAKSRKYVDAVPENLPKLKPLGQAILEIPSDEQVEKLIACARASHRPSFRLMADAGLRPNEVRALLRRDVLLRWEKGEPVGGFVSVREGKSHGEIHTPKTGQREIPVSPELAKLLAPLAKGEREGHVALNDRRKAWGQWGLDQAFGRVAKRAGLEGWSVYCLRHYAITSWLRAGVPVHVVQRMAGHKHLATTQKYVHFMKQDLEEAARRIANRRRSDAS